MIDSPSECGILQCVILTSWRPWWNLMLCLVRIANQAANSSSTPAPAAAQSEPRGLRRLFLRRLQGATQGSNAAAAQSNAAVAQSNAGASESIAGTDARMESGRQVVHVSLHSLNLFCAARPSQPAKHRKRPNYDNRLRSMNKKTPRLLNVWFGWSLSQSFVGSWMINNSSPSVKQLLFLFLALRYNRNGRSRTRIGQLKDRSRCLCSRRTCFKHLAKKSEDVVSFLNMFWTCSKREQDDFARCWDFSQC